jgi:hypothetical protein
MSKINEEIDAVSARMKAWQDCYNHAVEHLNKVTPLTQLIPADVAKLMNKQETEQATAHLKQVLDNLSEDFKVSSRVVLADFAVWRDATETYVSEHNQMMKNAPSEERQRDIEARKKNYAAGAGSK